MSYEAEQKLLACVLMDNRQFFVAGPIEPRDFSDQRHREIYAAISGLLKEGRFADGVSVCAVLGPEVAAYLEEIFSETHTAENAAHYARLIREASERKRLTRTLKDVVTDLAHRTPLREAKDRVMEALNDCHGHHDIKNFGDALGELEDHIREMQEAKDGLGIRMGLAGFDEETGGLYGNRLTILGARVSVGKTMFAFQTALNGARLGKGVFVVSLEAGGAEIAARVLGRELSIAYSDLLRGRNLAVEKLAGSDLRPIRDWPIFIDERARTLSDIRTKIYEAKFRFDIKLAILDHVQLVQTRGRNRFEELAEISRTMKEICRELQIPILVLSQLSRDVEREKREPRLSDLRESGNLEQDADQVLLMHPVKEEVEGCEPGLSYFLIVAKNRGGRAGYAIPLFVDYALGVVSELADRYD